MRALARGWTLNEYALSEVEGGKVIASETEEEIYAALGLPFIPPVLREDAGELEAADKGTLPRPLGAVIGDFHVHTTVSGDGRSTLEAMVATAKARGYRALTITDHAEGTLSGAGRDAFLDQRAKIAALRAELGDSLRLLHGVELNIGEDGALDYDKAFRDEFEFCIASVHDRFDLDRAAQTRRVVNAMRDPAVRMIGHLSARMIGARPPIDLDLDAVIAAAEETGTALEVNGGLPRLDMSVDALRRARISKATFVLTSDAHHESELRRVDYAKLNAERAWLTGEQVANTWDVERFLRWTEKKVPRAS
jgi:DNA polymerase (family X)